MDAHQTSQSAEQSSVRISHAVQLADLPLFLTVRQAAALLQVPVGTIYDWRSQGRLDNCSFRAGRHVRIDREKLLRHATQGKLARVPKSQK